MSHWTTYQANWSSIDAPLRPPPDAVAAMRDIVGEGRGTVLLLGVTPELALAFDDIHGLDNNPAMIAGVWPGDKGQRRASLGDWLKIGADSRRYRAVIGDGSLNNLLFPSLVRAMLAAALAVLEPGGRFACRLFERPEGTLTRAGLLALADGSIGFHAFKLRLAMELVDADANVAVPAIRDAFDELFPDRGLLAQRTGWARPVIDLIDVYRGSDAVYSFPRRAQALAQLPAQAVNERFLPSGRYDLAGCCPILTFTVP